LKCFLGCRGRGGDENEQRGDEAGAERCTHFFPPGGPLG
jgi:hypothetical protein